MQTAEHDRQGAGNQTEEDRAACRIFTRDCGRGCSSRTSATSSRRSIANGRSSRRTSARRRARCSAEADERVRAAVAKLLKRHKEGMIGLVLPEPLLSLARRFLTRGELGDLWKAPNGHGRFEVIAVDARCECRGTNVRWPLPLPQRGHATPVDQCPTLPPGSAPWPTAELNIGRTF